MSRVHVERLGRSNSSQPAGRQSIQIRPPATVKKSFQVKGPQPRSQSFPVVPPSLQPARESFVGAATTFTQPIFTAPVGGCFIRKVTITTDTTIAAHADDHWTFTLQLVGGTDIAGPLTTDSDTGAELTADTVFELTRVVGECDLAAGQIVELLATAAGGAADQSATKFNVEVEYVPKAASNDYVAALGIVPPTGMFIVDAKIIANTTVTKDAAAYYTFTLQTSAGAAIASYSTEDGVGDDLTANTAAAMTLVAAEQDQAAGVFLELKIDAATESAVSLGLIEFAVVISYLSRTTNDFTWPLMVAPTGGMFLYSAKINADTTVAQDAAAYYTFNVQTSAGVVLAARNTLTGDGGTLTANTVAAMTAVAGERDQVAGTVIVLKADAQTEAAADISSINFTVELEYVHGATSQDFALASFIVPTGGARFTSLKLMWDTTIAADAAAFYTFNFRTVGATVIATRNTETGVGGAATADAVNALTITAANASQVADVVCELHVDAATASSVDLSAMVGTLAIEYQAA